MNPKKLARMVPGMEKPLFADNDTFLARIDAYLAAHGEAASVFSLRVSRDHKLIAKLRVGKDILLSTARAIDAALQNPPPTS